MTLTVELLIIGDELLNGTIADGNSVWFGRQLRERGLSISYRQTVADSQSDIVAAMQYAAGRADIVITSGGLGPTVDDRTAEAAAAYLGEPLIENNGALASIRARRKAVGRELTPADAKQASLPKSATVLQNPVGTAPGFRLDSENTHFFHLPGVPHEFKALSEQYVLPEIDKRQKKHTISKTWKCFGITESGLAGLVQELPTDGLELHYRAHFPEIHLTVVTTDEERLKQFTGQFETRAGTYIFGSESDEFPAETDGLSL